MNHRLARTLAEYTDFAVDFVLVAMAGKSRILRVAALAGAIGTTGYAYHLGQVRQRATLQRFMRLEARVAANNQQASRQDKATIRGIKREVYRYRRQARDMAVLLNAEQIGFRTQTLIDTLHTLRQQLSATSGSPSTTDSASVYSLVTVPTATVAGLVAHLDRYAAFIRQFVPEAAPLTKCPPATPARPPKFGAFYFEARPLAAVLATYTQLEAQLRRYSAEALARHAEKVGSRCCFCFDRIALEAVPESNTVAPGATYRSQLFLGQAPAGIYFSVESVNGAPLKQLYPGHSQVELRVPPLQPGQLDTVRAQWRGVMRAEGELSDTVLQLNVPYFIVKAPAL